MKTFNPWSNMQRAIEIAIVSGEKIRPLSEDPIHGFFETEIKRLFKDSPINHKDIFSKDGSIYLHLVKPRYCPEYDEKPVIELDINQAIGKKVRPIPKPANYDPFASSIMVRTCNEYLHTFIQHNDVNKSDMEFIYRLSSYIAWLDGVSDIRLEQIIEASFYRSKEGAIYNLME